MTQIAALVTGGAGFIGSHLVDAIIQKGGRVAVLDDLSQSSGENLSAYASDSRVRFIQGSILDEAAVSRAMDGCTHVFHLAAVIGVRYVVDDPLRGILTNVRGTEIVLAEALRRGCRVLLAPTSVPRWSYALSKGLDEHLGLAYHRQHGLAISAVRYFNIYGPRCLPGGYGVIARFAERALTGRPLIVHGDGEQSRCFTYIDDAVQGTFLAGTMEAANGEVVNLGSTRETTIKELAHLVGEAVGGGVGVQHVPHEVEYGPGFEDTRRRVPDISKAERLLGFRASISLEDGLRRTLEWWRLRLSAHRPAEA